MAEQLILPRRITDANGDPVSGARLYAYLEGTSTLETVYSDEALTTAHPSPLTADAGGNFPPVWHSGLAGVKVRVLDASDVELSWSPLDPCPMTSSATTAEGISITPSAGNPANNVQDAVDNNSEVTSLYGLYPVTTGTGTAYVASTGLSLSSLLTGIPFIVVFHEECGDDPTLNIDGLGAVELHGRRRLNAGLTNLKAGQIQPGSTVYCRYNGTEFACWGDIRPREELEYAVKSADETRNSTTTNAVDGELDITVSEIGLYQVEIGIFSQAGSGAFKYRINTPANSEFLARRHHTGDDYEGDSNLTRSDTSGSTMTDVLTGILRNTESGNIQLSWSQNSSHGNDTTVLKNSYISLRYLGS